MSLVGTFAVLELVDVALNNLSLFGLALAVGIVVDDAIVVVENVERNIHAGMSPPEAAHRTMDEVGGVLISIALTLCAAFVPSAFLSGISGLLGSSRLFGRGSRGFYMHREASAIPVATPSPDIS